MSTTKLTLDSLHSYKLVAIKLMTPGKAHLEKHYADLAGKPFFPGLIECKLPPETHIPSKKRLDRSIANNACAKQT